MTARIYHRPDGSVSATSDAGHTISPATLAILRRAYALAHEARRAAEAAWAHESEVMRRRPCATSTERAEAERAAAHAEAHLRRALTAFAAMVAKQLGLAEESDRG